MTISSGSSPELIYSLRRVSESAALAAFDWIGRGDGMDGGRAALDAMLSALAEVDIDAVVVIGEAGKGEAPQPARGERLGRPGSAFKADIAMDPVEGTSYLAQRPDQRACRARGRSARRHDEPGARLLHGEVRGAARRRAARSIRTGPPGASSGSSPRC